MSDFYIYSSKYEKKNLDNEFITCSITVIFCSGDIINEINVQNEIKNFYEFNYQTDEIIIIGGDYFGSRLKEVFLDNYLETFKYVPKLQADHLLDGIYIYKYDKDGKLKGKPGKSLAIDKASLKNLINTGLVGIFNERGGLIEAKSEAHHFVFPSGKHCNKFLRTGNVLMYSSEIYFTAFCLLGYFKEKDHEKIYCDTSSINTLALALLDLKRRLIKDESFSSIPIVSFSSYDGLFSKKVRFFGNSLILISSSTSGHIIDRICKHDDGVDKTNIALLFFLGSEKDFIDKKNNIVCNLTRNEKSNPNGITYYDTYSEKDCIHCINGSYPVEVKGDVFLLEKPKINRITINITDAPKNLAGFVKQYVAVDKTQHNVLKVNYKETKELEKKYDVYFDMYHVLQEIESVKDTSYVKYKEKLFDHINQFIPSNTKFLISLPDEGSEKLAIIIKDQIKNNYNESAVPVIVKFDDFSKVMTDLTIAGAAVIIGSCISNGKNLLYLSRALRPYNKLRLVYFIGLVRTANSSDLEFLKKNLRQGNYGKETNSFVEVENFFCNNDSKNTSWIVEKNLLLDKFIDLTEVNNLNLANERIRSRIDLINNSFSKEVKGLSNQLFYSINTSAELELRKGFAFINFDNNINSISQADIYFTISAILNNLRNATDYEHCLKQSEFVRNILDPGNFNRYNDGIIQASILRASKQGELTYHIDNDLSKDMMLILEKIIDEHNTLQGEGLLEFLYAIAVKKLTLKREHLKQLLDKLKSIQEDELIKVFSLYIAENILEDKISLKEQIKKLESENEKLKLKFSSVAIV